jgi:AhpD family alkylhydroperoxidase
MSIEILKDRLPDYARDLKLNLSSLAAEQILSPQQKAGSFVAANGCGMCLEAHEKVCREHGLSAEQIQAAVRIAATIHAVARTLSAEEALAVPLAAAA